MSQQRKFPRLQKTFHMTYTVLDAENSVPGSGSVVNISAGGVCFEAPEFFPKQTLLNLEIYTDDAPAPIPALVEVVWCREQEGSYDVGAEFWWIGWQGGEEMLEDNTSVDTAS